MSSHSSSPLSFTFSSEDGRTLCKKILHETRWPHEPHDYQLEGVCKALNGVDLLAITPTGSGKSGFMVMYMLVYLAISQRPDFIPAAYRAGFQVKNPAIIVLCPTKALEKGMVMGVLTSFAIEGEHMEKELADSPVGSLDGTEDVLESFCFGRVGMKFDMGEWRAGLCCRCWLIRRCWRAPGGGMWRTRSLVPLRRRSVRKLGKGIRPRPLRRSCDPSQKLPVQASQVLRVNVPPFAPRSSHVGKNPDRACSGILQGTAAAGVEGGYREGNR